MSELGNKQIMAENIKHYMNIHNIDRRELSETLGVGYSTVTDWLNAVNYPRIDKIEMMAKLWNIEKSDLVENKDSNDKLNNNALRVAAHIDDNVTEEEMADIIKYIEFIKSQHK